MKPISLISDSSFFLLLVMGGVTVTIKWYVRTVLLCTNQLVFPIKTVYFGSVKIIHFIDLASILS